MCVCVTVRRFIELFIIFVLVKTVPSLVQRVATVHSELHDSYTSSFQDEVFWELYPSTKKLNHRKSW